MTKSYTQNPNWKEIGEPMFIEDAPSISIPTDVESLAEMLYSQAMDWTSVLPFLDKIAKTQNIDIDTEEVRKLLTEWYGE